MPSPAMNKILLVEDTMCQANLAMSYLKAGGYETDHAVNAKKAGQLFANNEYAAVILDLGLPDGRGEDLLARWRTEKPQTGILVLTANASVRSAVRAVRNGADDYLVKPVNREQLIKSLGRVAKRQGRNRETPAREKPVFAGASPVMEDVFAKISSFARSLAPVFITGQSGTGKELCALDIHHSSTRRNGPFIAVNCGAIPRELLESEFFGHIKGAFTGAVADRKGAAQLADGGTLFLDEICELEYSLQSKLLRFLQTGLIQPVGSAQTRAVDVRIICATNKTPKEEIAAGRFRRDLFYRLHVLPLHMPPLSARGDDVVLIGEHFRALYNRLEGKSFQRFSGDAVHAMLNYSWPGNVRELQNAVRQAIVLNDGVELTAKMLAIPEASGSAVELDTDTFQMLAGGAGSDGLLSLSQLERRAIEKAIYATGGSIPKAAQILDVSPSTIYRKIEAWK